MREQLQRVFMETATTTVLVSHDLEEAVYLSDRILLLSRLRRARSNSFITMPHVRARSRRCRSPTSSAPRRIASKCSSARFAGDERAMMNVCQVLLPFVGVAVLLAVWSLTVWARLVDPVLLPSPISTFPRDVDRDDQRQARRRFPQDGRAHDLFDGDRGRDRDPARHPAGLFGKGLSLGRVPDRLLPLHAGVRDVSVVPGAVWPSATAPRFRWPRSALRW